MGASGGADHHNDRLDSRVRLACAIALRMGLDPGDAEDLGVAFAARCFLQWSGACVQYAAAECPGKRLRRCASNFVCAARDQHPYARPLLDTDLPLPDPSSRALDRVWLADALAALPPRQRLIFLAHAVFGRTAAEIAAAVGSTPDAVAHSLARTRARLRALLQPQQATSPLPVVGARRPGRAAGYRWNDRGDLSHEE